MVESKELVQKIAQACDDKHAENIVILDMKNLSSVADYFIICHANNTRLVQTIAKEVKDVVTEQEIDVHVEGANDSKWIVVEADGVLCHIFHRDERLYYNLERLWGDAKQVPMQEVKES
ncbi:MAG TPA: ribosome silencing factor [Bacillota bacterium]|nr:ribosome silencing factor [Bacillota bacterium]